MIVIITATAKKFLVVTFLMDSEVTNSTVCYSYYKLDKMKNDPLKLLKYAVIIFEDPEETCGLLMTQQFPNFGWKIIVLDLLIGAKVLLLVYLYMIVIILTLEF